MEKEAKAAPEEEKRPVKKEESPAEDKKVKEEKVGIKKESKEAKAKFVIDGSGDGDEKREKGFVKKEKIKGESKEEKIKTEEKPKNKGKGKKEKVPVIYSVEDEKEEKYASLTQREHCLARPEVYLGSMAVENEMVWVYDEAKKHMVKRKMKYMQAFFHVFEELKLNAADNKQRDPSMTSIDIEVDAKSGRFSICNNGRPVEVRKWEGKVGGEALDIYVPELIFGRFLTGENLKKAATESKGKAATTVSGRFGYGAKLTNVNSKYFEVQVNDIERGKFYQQVWRDNMEIVEPPVISPAKRKLGSFTKIICEIDFPRFHRKGFDEDDVLVLRKRAIDLAGTCGTGIIVTFNGETIPTMGFDNYARLFLKEDQALAFDNGTDRWEVGVALQPEGTAGNGLLQTSFVNRIPTVKGGKHVVEVVRVIVKEMKSYILKRVKRDVKPAALKKLVESQLQLFINCLIEKPTFDAQAKTLLTTAPKDFGSAWVPSEKFLKQLRTSGLAERIALSLAGKDEKALKKTDGKRRSRVKGISKLEDANLAGSRKDSHRCTLILTEGDSAKALAVSGLSVVGRDLYGIYALRGKFINVRAKGDNMIMNNNEVTHLKQILGLQMGKEYADASTLRYGHVMIMTDQDHDGSHIKGLVINFFSRYWPSLLRLPDFIQEFITPLVKVTIGKKVFEFFSQTEFNRWKETADGKRKGQSIKYYKGLGTSTPQEGKEYFSNLDRYVKSFISAEQEDTDALILAFDKRYVEARKEWIGRVAAVTEIDFFLPKLTVAEFVNRRLIYYSVESNLRAIPSIMDSLKPGQRKIIYSAFKRSLKKEIKVAQFAGYVSENSSYHHGEHSLTATIIGMAQNYMGSNNINLLVPKGQFGTRMEQGADAAGGRYIFTHLSPITRHIFHPDDDGILNYLNDDGQSIEPEWYVGVLPLILVNGAGGIGTGWSTSMPCYDPRKIVDNVKRFIAKKPLRQLIPWWAGFKGRVEPVSGSSSYVTTGTIEKLSDTVLRISELPIGRGTVNYRNTVLEPMVDEKQLTFTEHHTDLEVDFRLTFHSADAVVEIEETGNPEKYFKLTSSIPTSSMVLFDHTGKLKLYTNPNEILVEFCTVRIIYYEKRKRHLLAQLEQKMARLENKIRFLSEANTPVLMLNIKMLELLKTLLDRDYLPLGSESKSKKKLHNDEDDESHDEDDEEDKDEEKDEEEEESKKKKKKKTKKKTVETKVEKKKAVEKKEAPKNQVWSEKHEKHVGYKDYKYLLDMPVVSITTERANALKLELAKWKEQHEEMKKTTPEELWLRDLDAFLEALVAHEKAMKLLSGQTRKFKVAGQEKKKKRSKGKSKSSAPSVPESFPEDTRNGWKIHETPEMERRRFFAARALAEAGTTTALPNKRKASADASGDAEKKSKTEENHI